jgi:hypothetical protein
MTEIGGIHDERGWNGEKDLAFGGGRFFVIAKVCFALPQSSSQEFFV